LRRQWQQIIKTRWRCSLRVIYGSLLSQMARPAAPTGPVVIIPKTKAPQGWLTGMHPPGRYRYPQPWRRSDMKGNALNLSGPLRGSLPRKFQDTFIVACCLRVPSSWLVSILKIGCRWKGAIIFRNPDIDLVFKPLHLIFSKPFRVHIPSGASRWGDLKLRGCPSPSFYEYALHFTQYSEVDRLARWFFFLKRQLLRHPRR